VELEVVLQVPPTELAWMRASDAMVPFAALAEDATWSDVAELLERCGLSQVPVARGEEILGWVGDRELRAVLLDGAAGDSRAPSAGGGE